MSKQKTEMREIKSLKVNLFVRKQLDANWAIHLAELLENGVDLSPIMITEDGTVIDGRHRIEAYEMNKLTHIPCIVREVKDETELIALAYRENAGGAKPPTKGDTEHTVVMLLDRKVKHVQIAELLDLPAALVRKYVKSLQTRSNTLKLQKVVKDIAENNTPIQVAADKEGVPVDKVKDFLSGVRKKRGTLGEEKATLTRLAKSNGAKISAVLKRVFEGFEDGDVTYEQAKEVIQGAIHTYEGSVRRSKDWLKRLDNLANGRIKT